MVDKECSIRLTGGGKRSNEEIAAKIPQYNKATISGQLTALPGLTKRRQQEQAMFAGGKSQPQPNNSLAIERAVEKSLQPTAPTPEKQAKAPGLVAPLVQMAMQGQAPIMHQGGGRQYTTASADPLIKKDDLVRTFNNGGGTWWNPLSWFDQDEAKTQQFGNALKNRPGFRNLDPFAGTIVDEVPAQPTLGTRPFSETPYAPIVDGAVNQLNNLSVPVYNADGTPPQLDMATTSRI